MLDRLPLGVIVVDAGGRVITKNRSASEIAKRADGLGVDGGGICRAEGAKERARLADMIARAASSEPGPGAERARAMKIPRPSQQRPLSVLVAPLTGKGARAWVCRRGGKVIAFALQNGTQLTYAGRPMVACDAPVTLVHRDGRLTVDAKAEGCLRLWLGRGSQPIRHDFPAGRSALTSGMGN